MYPTKTSALRTAQHSRSVSLRRGSCFLPSAIKNDQRHLLPWNKEGAADGNTKSSNEDPSKVKVANVSEESRPELRRAQRRERMGTRAGIDIIRAG